MGVFTSLSLKILTPVFDPEVATSPNATDFEVDGLSCTHCFSSWMTVLIKTVLCLFLNFKTTLNLLPLDSSLHVICCSLTKCSGVEEIGALLKVNSKVGASFFNSICQKFSRVMPMWISS